MLLLKVCRVWFNVFPRFLALPRPASGHPSEEHPGPHRWERILCLQ